MVAKPIPDHIWSHILPFLQKPIPKPLSRPPRSELRQQDLVSSSLVSKLFNEICNPLLFKRIVTDDLPKLLSHIDQPSNRKLFSLTRSLFVEYSAKGEEPDYLRICQEGRRAWGVLALDQTQMLMQVVMECGLEMADMTSCLRSIQVIGGATVFPRLETLAVASIYGSDSRTSAQHNLFAQTGDERIMAAANRRIEVCNGLFDDFVGSLRLSHLCLRDTLGPLSFSSIIWASTYAPASRPVTTFHITPQPPHFKLPLGWPARITCDTTPDDDWAQILQLLEFHIFRVSQFRKENLWRGKASDTADIEIFCSTMWYGAWGFAPSAESFGVGQPIQIASCISRTGQAEMVEALGNSVQERLRLDSGLEDKVKWRISAETPICGACSSGPPA